MEFISAFQNSPPLFAMAAILFGLLVGSFLNVVIHRLPKMLERDWKAQCLDYLADGKAEADAAPKEPPANSYNLVVPRSACPTCGHRITALENIPVMSWLVLRGKCSGCGTRISVRYPIVELLTGLLTGYIAWRFGFTMAGGCAMLFCWALIALTFIDADTQLLPDDITLPLLWLGLLANLTLARPFTDLSSAVLGAVFGYLSLWLVYWGFKLLTRKEGMGYGDFKLLAALGAWMGWQMLPLIILLSAMVGAVVGIVGIIVAGREKGARIPFGPYLAAAGFIALLWGHSINAWYLGH